MTTITIDRAIVEQALEEVEHLHRTGDTQVFDLCYAPELIPALRAALAQQAEPVEPVATVTECEACFTPDVCQLRGTCDYYTASQMRIAAPPQQAEPDHETRAELAEQQVVQLAEERDHYRNLWQKAQQAEPVEPVAWRFEARHIDTAFGPAVSLKHPGPEHKYMRNVEPLYTAPPQRKQAEPVQEPITRLFGTLPVHDAQQAEPVEPVAWRVQRSDGQYELYFVKASAERAAECYIKRPQVEPLYTAPPQRKLELTKATVL